MHKAGLILLLLFLVSPVLMGPGAARADGVALANAGHQAQLQGQWDEAIKLSSFMAPHSTRATSTPRAGCWSWGFAPMRWACEAGPRRPSRVSMR